MSLDIELSNGNELNWLRNPFGLERWARNNVECKITTEFISGTMKKDENGYKYIDWETDHSWNLWDVTNNFCYSGAKYLNEKPINTQKILRKLFKIVVDAYWEEIQKLDKGYFYFDLPAYRQFVEGQFEGIIEGSEYSRDYKYLKIPIEIYEKKYPERERKGLTGYKDWFKQLVIFADELQDLDNKFSGSN